MTSPWPNPAPLPGPPSTVPDLGCGHLPGECPNSQECAYWRGVVLGEYAPPTRWSVTADGVEASR